MGSVVTAVILFISFAVFLLALLIYWSRPRGKGNVKVKVKTGHHAYPLNITNLHFVLYNQENQPSREFRFFRFFQRNTVESLEVKLPSDFGRVVKIKIWHGFFEHWPSWYINTIRVINDQQTFDSIFPVFRWIQSMAYCCKNSYKITEFDTLLPQFDPHPEQRQKEIERKRTMYTLKYEYENIPMVNKLPFNEKFSPRYLIQLLMSTIYGKIQDLQSFLTPRHWTSLDDIDDMYSHYLKRPTPADHWKKDAWFGNQRLVGCNPNLITLCTKIPKKFGVTEEMMEPVLGTETLKDLIAQKRLFYTDLYELDGLHKHEQYEICAPMALFKLDDDDQLLPIAIQLNQEKGPDNPVFLPTDEENVWLLAKMWYNNAEASLHQAVFHLGWTHLIMEGVIAALQRNVSMSHPILKLLVPHTYYMFQVNKMAIKLLLSPNGWINTVMNIGVENVFKLVSNINPKWRIDLEGIPPKEFASRNVEDPNVLPNYHFRDDTLIIYNIIHDYVKAYVQLYYDDDNVVLNDSEMQRWAEDLSKDTSIPGGIGIKGVPQRNGKGGFNTIDDLIMVISAVIYTCSAGHAAVNFLQYTEYSFPPNYPAQLRGKIISDKNPRTESDLVQAVPDPAVVLNIMSMTNTLSQKNTDSLGDFEVQYIYDPQALKILDKFRAELRKASAKIHQRNMQKAFPYEVLLPENIPNAISI